MARKYLEKIEDYNESEKRIKQNHHLIIKHHFVLSEYYWYYYMQGDTEVISTEVIWSLVYL